MTPQIVAFIYVSSAQGVIQQTQVMSDGSLMSIRTVPEAPNGYQVIAEADLNLSLLQAWVAAVQ